jgi:DNA-binding MarR family transcriptional regulator
MDVSAKEINALSSVWHRLVVSLQKTSEELWKDNLTGVSTIEISILDGIHRGYSTTKELMQSMEIPGSTLTNALDRLERRKLIKREINRADRRTFRLELTERGKAAQDEHIRGEEVLWRKIFSAFPTAAERGNLLDVLNKIADTL